MPNYGILWQNGDKIALNVGSNTWFDVRVRVKGDTATIYINNTFVHSEKFTQIPAGKIGFRNDGPEKALVKDIRVSLLPYE